MFISPRQAIVDLDEMVQEWSETPSTGWFVPYTDGKVTPEMEKFWREFSKKGGYTWTPPAGNLPGSKRATVWFPSNPGDKLGFDTDFWTGVSVFSSAHKDSVRWWFDPRTITYAMIQHKPGGALKSIPEDWDPKILAWIDRNREQVLGVKEQLVPLTEVLK